MLGGAGASSLASEFAVKSMSSGAPVNTSGFSDLCVFILYQAIAKNAPSNTTAPITPPTIPGTAFEREDVAKYINKRTSQRG